MFCILCCSYELNNKFCRPSIFLAFFLFCSVFLFLLLCCSQMQHKGHVSSCSSAGYCKLEPRAGPLHGTHGRRGDSEVRLPWPEAVTDSVVAKECDIMGRWLLGMAVMGILKCFDWFLVAIDILSGCLVLLSAALSPSPVTVGNAALALQMPVIPCLCHYYRKTWRCELWRVKYLRSNKKKKILNFLL